MTSLVTGATGFIGGAVVRAAAAAGAPVRALAHRSPPEEADRHLPGVEWVTGDLLDRTALREAMAGCDQVYHIGGAIETHPSARAHVRAVNVTGAANVFDLALELGVRRVVYTGSIFALGLGNDPAQPADEAVPYNLAHLRSPYIRAKREAEVLAQAYQARGLDIVIVYPGFCAGPGDRHLTSSRLIVAYLRRQLPGYLPGGLCQIDVRDAARAHVLAMGRGQAGARYLVPGHNVTYRAIFDVLARLIGRRAPSLCLPLAPLDLAGGVLERFSRHPLLDRGVAQLLHHTWWYNDAHARAELGITYRPLDGTFADAITWFLAHGVITPRQAGKLATLTTKALPAPVADEALRQQEP
jgi:dihydroflavonol-4-reductase